MRTALLGLALVASAPSTFAAPAAVPLERPALESRQGRYFRWMMPRGWTVKETSNGVDLFSPDGKTLVSSALVHGSMGKPSPRQFLAMVMGQVNPSAQVLASRPLPRQRGIWGPWVAEDFELQAQQQGTPVRLGATVGVSEGHGRYSATMTLYQAPASRWAHDKLWLPAVAQSIAATNLRELAGQNGVVLPRNNPLDNSGLIESWRRKGLSEDRISQGRHEGTMGYERLEDVTGRRYDMPIEAYDSKVGGYRDPNRPTELLRKLPPGY